VADSVAKFRATFRDRKRRSTDLHHAIIEKEFPFIPDSKISWIEDGDVYSAIRDGRKIELGVRVFPEFTMAQCAILRERLLSGIDPRKVVNFSKEEMEELKRCYIPRA
jgi:hypothetical protein